MGQNIRLKVKGKTHDLNHDLNHDLTFSPHTINYVCHSISFRVLGIYNFAGGLEKLVFSQGKTLYVIIISVSICYYQWINPKG